MGGSAAWGAPLFVPGGGHDSSLLVDWEVTSGSAPVSTFRPAPFLSDANAAEVDQFFATQSAELPRVVKVVEDLSPGGPAVQVFDNYRIDYVFADYESADAGQRTQTLVSQVQSSLESSEALVGNFNFAVPDFGVSMTNTALYPGSPGSEVGAAPNIRSQLFINQIKRFEAFESAGGAAPHIPYVTRFNNWGNAALDTDGDASNGFAFDTRSGTTDVNQLPSRADFRVLAQTYRLLGADGLHVFESGVVSEGAYGDYTKEELETDALAGWNLLSDAPDINGGTVSAVDYIESQGVAWASLANAQSLWVFISNLSESSQDVMLGTIEGMRVGDVSGNTLDDELPVGQEHWLWSFDRVRIGHGPNREWVWDLDGSMSLFTDAELLNRQGVGIPEPTTAVWLAAGSALLLCRRRNGPGSRTRTHA